MTTDTPTQTPEPPPRGNRRGPWVVGGVVAVLAVVGVVLWLVLGGDDGDDDTAGDGGGGRTVEAPDPVEPDLDEGGQELIELMAQGRQQDYHAVYEGEGDIGGTLVVEVWRRGGDIRQDSRFESDGNRSETAGIVVDDTTVLCSRVDDQDWVCAEQEGSSETSLDGVFGITSQLDGVEVTPTDETIDGREARCFAAEGEDGRIRLCLDEDGIPVRLENPTSALALSELSADVPGDAFEPPAEPAQGDGE